MALTVVWEKCAVDKPTKDGGVEDVVLRRGETLPDFVTDFRRSVLVMIGAVRDLGAAVQIVQDAADAQLAPEPAPPVYPPEVPPVTPTAATPATVTAPVTEPAVQTKPGAADSKETWESYAVSKSYFTQAEAEAMTKTKLVAEVNKRESN